MAIPIKQVPILSGEIADEFERQADARLAMPRRTVSAEERRAAREMHRQLREAVPSWHKQIPEA